MPHVSVTMYPGCTESEKREFTNRIVSSVVEITGAEERVVSVTVEEVSPERWPEAVYRPGHPGEGRVPHQAAGVRSVYRKAVVPAPRLSD